jgi:hypothetical protein
MLEIFMRTMEQYTLAMAVSRWVGLPAGSASRSFIISLRNLSEAARYLLSESKVDSGHFRFITARESFQELSSFLSILCLNSLES